MDILQLSTVVLNMHGHNGDVEGFLHVVWIADDRLDPRVAIPGVLVDFQGTFGSNEADKPGHLAARGEERRGEKGRGQEGVMEGKWRGGRERGEGGGDGSENGGRGMVGWGEREES